MEKFKNKYRIQSHRKPNWDYSADALYFLTIVTQNRNCNLGSIIDDEMVLSDFGKIVETEWFKSFEIRNELLLHEFILMPNHLHAIVEIISGDTDDTTDTDDTDDTAVDTHGRVYLPSQSSQSSQSSPPSQSSPSPPSPPDDDDIQIKRNPPIRLPKSISSFIAGFKSSVNSKIDDYIDEYNLSLPKYNRNNHFFQPNYHDHIIRNDFEYNNIRKYIQNNPRNWNKDRINKTKNV